MDGVRAGTYASDWQQLDSTDPQSAWEYNMAVGARDNRGVIQDFWDGAIDSLRVYDHALTQTEMDAIWAAESVCWKTSGDINGDGFVGIADLNIVLGTWNNGTPPAAGSPSIPEPASLSLLAIGGVAMLRRRA
ncbi:MAG: PEP-CTERM sorting domain-containing protein [Phycisphaerales bacterium]